MGDEATKITQDHIDSVISGADFYRHGLLTVCILTLTNGFLVSGESACAHPDNYDEQIGRDIAQENAREKIWMLEGYLLRQKLFEQGK
jgi:hypothetical protein